jgi:hypothetical protein
MLYININIIYRRNRMDTGVLFICYEEICGIIDSLLDMPKQELPISLPVAYDSYLFIS